MARMAKGYKSKLVLGFESEYGKLAKRIVANLDYAVAVCAIMRGL